MSADEPRNDTLVDWLLARDRETAAADESDPGLRPPGAGRLLKFLRRIGLDEPTGEPPTDDRPPDEPPRRAVNGRYTGLELVGRGGGGAVYKAWDTVLDQPVALKFLRADADLIPRAHACFHNEAKILAALDHPNVVRILDYGIDQSDGRPFLRMNWVSGGSLAARRDEFAGRPREAARLTGQVARAIQYAHDRRVLHRDLKPGNILLDEAGTPRVADFGIARLLQMVGDRPVPVGVGPAAERNATDGLGTPPYMAPEQFRDGFGPVGPAADVWAIGVVLYELLTGRRPFDGDTHHECEEAVCTRTPVRPRAIDRRIPRDLEAVCLKCLARRPEDRWASAGAVADALGARPAWRAIRAVGLAVLAVATGVLLALSWYNPEAWFKRQTAAAQERLGKDGRLDLLAAGADGKALAVKRWGAEATDLRQDADGFGIDTPLDASLIEMLSAVPAERYTIRAEVRIDWNRSGRGEFGVYCRHAGVATAAGPQHLLEGLFLSGGADANSVQALLQPRWYGTAGPAERHQREIQPAYLTTTKQRYVREAPGVRFAPAPGSTVQVSMNAPGRQPTPPVQVQHLNSKTGAGTVVPQLTEEVWWELAVSVAPAGTTATWSPAGGPPLGPLTAADRRPILDAARRRYPDVAATDPGRWDGTAVGLYVASMRCTIRRLELTLDSDE